jgi:hypothetical protein
VAVGHLPRHVDDRRPELSRDVGLERQDDLGLCPVLLDYHGQRFRYRAERRIDRLLADTARDSFDADAVEPFREGGRRRLLRRHGRRRHGRLRS